MTLSNGRLFIPKDIVVAKECKEGADYHIVKSSEGVPEGFEGVDIGPETILEYAAQLKKASTVIWNGPLGVFEIPEFAKGTNAIAHILAQIRAISIVGGGDSIAAVQAAGVADKMTHLSTGGGASLEYIEFGKLPGIEVLTTNI